MAHFYRDCEIWPRLNPSSLLAPSIQPIRRAISKGLRMGGPGDVRITASVHRLYWVAGQPCFIHVTIRNETKKTIKNLSLNLFRCTTIFKPKPGLDVDAEYGDPDACQTSTSIKELAQSVLEMGQSGTRGHASAKGWWSGVRPCEAHSVTHSLAIPVLYPFPHVLLGH